MDVLENSEDVKSSDDAAFKAMQESGELEALREKATKQLLQKAGIP